MTRINCVPVGELSDKHLLAEYRELPRVFKLARECPGAPTEYTLGPGHVKFFYNKLNFLYERQWKIVEECKRRGFRVVHDNPNEFIQMHGHKTHLWNNWTPTAKAMEINRQRIKERTK